MKQSSTLQRSARAQTRFHAPTMKTISFLAAVLSFQIVYSAEVPNTITVDNPSYNSGTTVDLNLEGSWQGELLPDGRRRFEGYIQVDREHIFSNAQKMYHGAFYIGESPNGGKSIQVSGNEYWKVFPLVRRNVVIIGKVHSLKTGLCVDVDQIIYNVDVETNKAQRAD